MAAAEYFGNVSQVCAPSIDWIEYTLMHLRIPPASGQSRQQEFLMKRFLSISALLVLAALSLVACGGGANGGQFGDPGANPSAVFVTGEDAPLPSVLSYNTTITSIALNGTSSTPAEVLSAPITVDFARLLGLRSLIGFNAVPADTYSSATITFADGPVITYLHTGTVPPTAATLTGTLVSTSVTANFPAPMVVASHGLAGMHLDFNLRQSLLTAAGQITGGVNPQISIQAVSASDEEGEITDFTGGLVSVSTANHSFVMQGPFGSQETIELDSQTQFNPGWSLNTLAPPAVVSIEGAVQGDGSILARNVEVISTAPAFISGRVIAVNPISGPVQSVTLYIGEELPSLTGPFAAGSVTTLDISAVAEYDVCFFDNWFTNPLFDGSSMAAGQRVFIGGSWTSSTETFTPSLISLRRQGVVGDLVTGSVNITSGNQGSFQFDNSNLLGYLVGGPLTVNTGSGTLFVGVNGLSGMQSSGATNFVARGLVFKGSGPVPVMWAHRVRVLQ